jgi:hypothetical protein
VVQLPFLTRPVCLPVLARLWRPRHTGKIAFVREMVEAIAASRPDRLVHAVGDAAYVGEHLRGPHPRITGRPRTKGPRLGTPADLAATAIGRTTEVSRYGRTDTVDVTEIVCLRYGAFHSRTVRVILVRDDKPHPASACSARAVEQASHVSLAERASAATFAGSR